MTTDASQKFEIIGRWELFLPDSNTPLRSGSIDAAHVVAVIKHNGPVQISENEDMIEFVAQGKGSVKIGESEYAFNYRNPVPRSKKKETEPPTIKIKAAKVMEIK